MGEGHSRNVYLWPVSVERSFKLGVIANATAAVVESAVAGWLTRERRPPSALFKLPTESALVFARGCSYGCRESVEVSALRSTMFDFFKLLTQSTTKPDLLCACADDDDYDENVVVVFYMKRGALRFS